ncbi:unnamed protein product [Cuscuta epithymum]|uniref:Uncharacterized protein n=1 Tax=Cuscuta epithymum TaxID=186058 RepID=A0AAV0E9F5_9ASTE|nr:unnamed protein product [Cuscuta epithymum]
MRHFLRRENRISFRHRRRVRGPTVQRHAELQRHGRPLLRNPVRQLQCGGNRLPEQNHDHLRPFHVKLLPAPAPNPPRFRPPIRRHLSLARHRFGDPQLLRQFPSPQQQKEALLHGSGIRLRRRDLRQAVRYLRCIPNLRAGKHHAAVLLHHLRHP